MPVSFHVGGCSQLGLPLRSSLFVCLANRRVIADSKVKLLMEKPVRVSVLKELDTM
jgi:hypothetical protein